MIKEFDYVIFGAGIYGLYAAKILAEKRLRIAVVEIDNEPFQRASYINQARVHNGYHYPRSFSTAITTAKYFDRFCKDFHFAIDSQLEKIYAVAKHFTLASGKQFKKFCENANIPCEEIAPAKYFNSRVVEEAYITKEYDFDSAKIKDYFVEQLKEFDNVEFFFNYELTGTEEKGDRFHLKFKNDNVFFTPYVINATYSGINQIIDKFNFDKLKLKYEICEMILCNVSDNISNIGLTVMDGPFFSLMPFGFTGFHSLSTVTFTPHDTSYEDLPTFGCQNSNPECSPSVIRNCNFCPVRPQTAWAQMNQLAMKFLNPSIEIKYGSSLFAVKSILLSSEIDDSRPTIVKKFSKSPTFISVLSGKINTIYDIEDVLL